MLRMLARFLCLASAVLMAASSAAQTVTPTWTFADSSANSLGTNKITITQIQRIGISTPLIHPAEPIRGVTVSNAFTTNLFNGFAYRIEIATRNDVYAFTNYFGTNVTGAVDASLYTSLSTNLSNADHAYSIAAANKQFLERTNGVGDSVTLYGTNTFRGKLKFPAGSVGNVWTQTNADGSGEFQATSSGGSGETNTASNLGTGEGIATTKAGVNLPFKSLKVAGGLTISSDSTSVTVNGSAKQDALTFNANQFDTTGNQPAIKNGALVTNVVLYDTSGTLSGNVTDRILYDNLGVISMDWYSRLLRNAAGVSTIDWNGKTFPAGWDLTGSTNAAGSPVVFQNTIPATNDTSKAMNANTLSIAVAGTNITVTITTIAGGTKQVTIDGLTTAQLQTMMGNLGVGIAAGGTLSATGAVNTATVNVTNAANFFGALVASNGVALTVSQPIDLSQVWNNSGVTFTGIKFNAVNTASAAASLLLDLQTSGTSEIKVTRAGVMTIGNAVTFTPNFGGSGRLQIGSDFYIGESGSGGTAVKFLGMVPNGGTPGSATATVIMFPDADDVVGQRRSTNPQDYRVYNTFTSRASGNTSLEYMSLKAKNNIFVIESFVGAQGGTARDILFATGGSDNNGTLTEGTGRARISASDGGLSVTNGFRPQTRWVAFTNYTGLVNDAVLITGATNNLITLYSPTNANATNLVITVVNTNAFGSSVLTNGGQLINGSLSLTLAGGSGVTLFSDGANYAQTGQPASGTVLRIDANGATQIFKEPNALPNAVAAASVGDAFELKGSLVLTNPVVFPGSNVVYGAGNALIESRLTNVSQGACLVAFNATTLRNFSIFTTNVNVSLLIGTRDAAGQPSITNAVYENITMNGGIDGFYCVHSNFCSQLVVNPKTRTQMDTFVFGAPGFNEVKGGQMYWAYGSGGTRLIASSAVNTNTFTSTSIIIESNAVAGAMAAATAASLTLFNGCIVVNNSTNTGIALFSPQASGAYIKVSGGYLANNGNPNTTIATMTTTGSLLDMDGVNADSAMLITASKGLVQTRGGNIEALRTTTPTTVLWGTTNFGIQGFFIRPTNAAPTGVTLGVTAPDFWVVETNSGVATWSPRWTPH